MTTSVHGQKIATTGSDHVAPGPLPAASFTPPLPPGPGPVPAPFVYLARSATAKKTKNQLMVGGAPVLVPDSIMSIEMPGNEPSRPVMQTAGADIVTRSLHEFASVVGGFSRVLVDQQMVAATTTRVGMNAADGAQVWQLQSALIEGVNMRAPGFDAAAAAAKVVGMVDPVSAATGDVIDEADDLELPGLVPLAWKRCYCSARAAERTPLGVGGWTTSLHSYVRVEADRLTYRDGAGRDVSAALPAIGEARLLRGLRIELRRTGAAVFEIHGLETRLVQRFEPLVPQGPAMLRAVRNAWGVGVELVYSEGRLERVVGRAGRELRLRYDAEGRVAKVELWARGRAWRAVSYGYGEEGELATVTGVTGAVDRYGYDGAHRMVTKTFPTGLCFHYEYDETTGRCLRAWGDGALHEGRFHYDDAAGTTTLTGNPEATIYHRDARGAITAVARSDRSATTRIRYDDDLLVTAIADDAGNEYTFEYDARGNLLRSRGPGGPGVSNEYRDDLLTKRRDAAGLVTEYAYDGRGAMVAVSGANGLRLTLDYDGAGRMTAIHGGGEDLGVFAHDDEDNVVSEGGPLGVMYRYGHDALGQITSVTDALGRVTRLAYDAAGRVTAITYPDGAVTRSSYDALGRVETATDPNGAVTRYRYGGVRSALEIRLPDGSAWTGRYDRAERPRSLENARGEVWEWCYDRAGHVLEQRAFDGRILRYAYSPAGTLARIDHPDGTWRSFAKNAAGLTLFETSSHGALRCLVDAQDRITEAAVQDGADTIRVSTRYDDFGRVVAETQDGLSVEYRYDATGALAERTLPGGIKTRFEYDRVGRVAKVEHAGAALAFEYDAVNNETRRRFEPAGVEVLTESDAMDRVARVTVLGRRRGVLVERSYGYDACGRRTSTTDAARGTASYEHDALGQLVATRSADGEAYFDHDAVGSVTNVRGTGRRDGEPWSVGPGNVLERAGDVDFVYDRMRRRIRRSARRAGEQPAITEYAWDCRDRLREVRFPDGARVVYTYDAFGRRLRKDFYAPFDPARPSATPHRTVRYVWQACRVAAELDSAHGTRVFVYKPGGYLPLLEEQGGRAFMFVCDPLGTPQELVDERGEVAWRTDRDVWGARPEAAPAPAPDAIRSPLSLLGHYEDPETGFGYAWNRYFDPATLRWLSPDPLHLEGGRNPASFNGSAVVHADPDGLARCMLGRPASDPPFRNVAVVPSDPRRLEIVVHGLPYHVLHVSPDGRVTVMNAQQFAAWLRTQPFYRPGVPIVLVSCYTGRFSNGFAAQLANEIGVPVTAPTRGVGPVIAGPNAGGLQAVPASWDPTLRIPQNEPAVWPTFWPAGATPGPATPPFLGATPGSPLAPPGAIPNPAMNNPSVAPLPGAGGAGGLPFRPAPPAAVPPAAGPPGTGGLPFRTPGTP